jgi:hypothetical protein
VHENQLLKEAEITPTQGGFQVPKKERKDAIQVRHSLLGLRFSGSDDARHLVLRMGRLSAGVKWGFFNGYRQSQSCGASVTRWLIAVRSAAMRLIFGSICLCFGLTHCSLVTVPLGTAGSLAGAGIKAGGSMASSTVKTTGGFAQSGMQAMNRPIQPQYAPQYPQQQYAQPYSQGAYPQQGYPRQAYPQQQQYAPVYPQQQQPQGQWYQGRWYPYSAQQR